MTDDTVIIRPLDKSSQIVAMNTQFYRKLLEQHLENDKTYIETNSSNLIEMDKNMQKLLNKRNTPFFICFLPINYFVSIMYKTFQQLVIHSTMYN